MPTLKLVSNNVANALTVDLSAFLRLNDGDGTDPAAPSYSNRVWSRSLLKAGATLSYEQLQERELVFPVHLNAASTTALNTLVQQINQCIETPGAIAQWQDDGASQVTTFDLLSGLLEIQYSYRKAQQHWLSANLRLFAQPLGRTAGPRPYASASGVGPLLLISPYASSGAQVIGASTQAGVAGFGGQQQGASSGVFYWGSPSLAGDAPAQLQISYTGPLPNNATESGTMPYTLVSLLPDPLYRPLITAPQITPITLGGGFQSVNGASETLYRQSTSVASSYRSFWTGNLGTGYTVQWTYTPLAQPSYTAQEPTQQWAGQHRLLAIARASSPITGMSAAALGPAAGGLIPFAPAIPVPNGLDWSLYDLGTFSLRASEAPSLAVNISGTANPSQALDLAGFIQVPDNSTWFLNPTNLIGHASQYGIPSSCMLNSGRVFSNFAIAPYTNTLLIDDTVGDQFAYWGQSQTFTPSPTGAVPSAARLTPFTRGLVPAPDPKGGLPIIAILSVAQNSVASQGMVDHIGVGGLGGIAAASWTNQQNLPTYAQVAVVERFRYVSP